MATGRLTAGHYTRRRRREFLAFMNDVLAEYPGRELHVVLDNLNTHKPKDDRWLARHPRRAFPLHAHARELAQSDRVLVQLEGARFTSVPQLREAIDRCITAYNARATPFEWRKRVVHSVGLKPCYADLRS